MSIIVICGDPASGLYFHGPFPDLNTACEWAALNISSSWSTAELHVPEEAGDVIAGMQEG